ATDLMRCEEYVTHHINLSALLPQAYGGTCGPRSRLLSPLHVLVRWAARTPELEGTRDTSLRLVADLHDMRREHERHAPPHTEADLTIGALPFRDPPGGARIGDPAHESGDHRWDEPPPLSRKAIGVYRNCTAEGPRPLPRQREGDSDHPGGDR